MKSKYLYIISIFMILFILLMGNGGSNSGGILNDNLDIISVNTFETNQEVNYGTTISNVLNNLPQEVSVNLSGGNKIEIPIAWSGGISSYKSKKPGTYNFFGIFDLSNSNYKNPASISLKVEVRVKESEFSSMYKPLQIDDVVDFVNISDAPY